LAGLPVILKDAEFSVSDTVEPRLARFFSIQHTKTGKNIPNGNKMYQTAKKIPFGRKMDKMAVRNINIFHCKAFQNLPKLGFLV
jgi:hypothetical protein